MMQDRCKMRSSLRLVARAISLALCFAPISTAPSLADDSAASSLTDQFIANASGHEVRVPQSRRVAHSAAEAGSPADSTASDGGSFFDGVAPSDAGSCPHCGGAHPAEAHAGPYGPSGSGGPGDYDSSLYPGAGFMDQGAGGGTYHFFPRDWDELVNGSVRHKGLGVPLLRESWNYRPWHIDWFAGVMWGDDMGKYQAERGGGAFGGIRLGEDWGNYLGWETRFAFASLDMNNLGSDYWLDDTEDFYWDTSLVYYPWGDSLWRPYFSLGLGLARFQFYKDEGARADESSFSLPLGMGLKYRYSSWLAFRLDFTDNASFAGGLPWMNSYSLTAGMEFHFGGRRRSYQAWNPGRHHW